MHELGIANSILDALVKETSFERLELVIESGEADELEFIWLELEEP